MAYNDITKMTPTSTLWVQAGAATGGDGSAERPFATIQAAVGKAVPGTAIMVREGTYVENVRLPATGGSDSAPIWLMSADGQGAAHIIAKSASLPAIKALGTDNVMIDGFTIEGGTNGIQFSMSGSNFTNMVKNVVISNNTILNAKEDGIKISQADNVQILNNKVVGAGDQGIDFVAVNDSVIIANDVSGVTGPAAIFTKGGSTNIEISGNWVHDSSVDGIALGGWTGEAFFRPGFDTYEAKNITVSGNYIEGVGKRPVNILGAVDSEVSGNILKTNPNYFTAISIENGSPQWTSLFNSENVTIAHNIFDRGKNLLSIVSGNGEGLIFVGNTTNGIGEFNFAAVGPGAATGLPSNAAGIALPAFIVGDGATSRGTTGADIFDGSDGNNKIEGRAGADLVMARGGNDQIFMKTGLGSFFVDGGEGQDVLRLDDSDTAVSLTINISNPAGLQILSDGSAFKNIEQLKVYYAGSSAAINVTGGAWGDIIQGGDGKDTMRGGGGSDWLMGNAYDKIYGDAGNDRIEITGHSFIISGGDGTDTLTIKGKTTFAANSLTSVEKVFMVGGAEIDFSALTNGLVALAVNGADAGVTVTGTSKADGFVGTNFADKISTGFGNDSVKGFGGDDYISAGDGNDYIVGGEGNDTIYGGGNFDIAVFSGAREDYSIVKTSKGFVVTDLAGNDGQDMIYQVEQFNFSDGNLLTATIL